MLAIVGAVLFVIAFIINAADISAHEIFMPTSLMLLGLALVALHVGGIGSGWGGGRTRR
ncbi:hypothetical protein ACQPZG_10575 [Streptomyces sp. CA-294286]|uniref:Uncharacterized protein n=1 Tax=Streptomyces candidus TaxID=67283 RepID=A0A7X0LRM0_9ACTN|nr:hypothetical protein [Streptomyces candidus]MBB6438237.1 hypothetical protein [Streptomyces candidus]GHH51639.1 hypothetical protein GCM10018773_50400 [Streptomyces candidus]